MSGLRTILFRGKAVGGEYITGYYLKKIQPCGRVDHIIHDGRIEHRVIRESVGQYTGFNDSNGVMIFENDTVSSPNYNIIGKVWFISGAFRVVYSHGASELLCDLSVVEVLK